MPRVGTVGRQGLSAPSRCPAPACGSRGDALMMFGVSGHRLAVPPSASRATAVGAAVSRGADSSQTAEDAPSVRTRARAAEKSVDRAVARGRECDGELCVVGEPECRRLPGAVRSSAFWKTWTRRRLTGETPSLPGRGPAGAAARRRERSSGDPSTLQTTRQQARSRGPGWVAVLAGAAWPGLAQLLRPRPLRPGPRAARVTNGRMTETSLATATATAHRPTLGGDRLCRPGPPRRRLPRPFPGGAGFARGPAAGQEGR